MYQKYDLFYVFSWCEYVCCYRELRAIQRQLIRTKVARYTCSKIKRVQHASYTNTNTKIKLILFATALCVNIYWITFNRRWQASTTPVTFSCKSLASWIAECIKVALRSFHIATIFACELRARVSRGQAPALSGLQERKPNYCIGSKHFLKALFSFPRVIDLKFHSFDFPEEYYT